MIIPFTIDPAALREQIKTPSASANDRLIRYWRELGLLIILEASVGKSELIGLIQDLPISVRKKWQVALMNQRLKTLVVKDLALFTSFASLKKLENEISVICIDNGKAKELGLTQEAFIVPNCSIEMCLFDCIDESDRFRKSAALAHSPVSVGTSVDEIWNSRFQSLSNCSKQVTIVDLYAGKSLYENQYPERTGLARLLNELASKQHLSVQIFTSTHGINEARLVAAIKNILPTGKTIRSLRLFLSHEASFKKEFHDRYVRFDRTVVNIGFGLEIFYGETVQKLSTINITSSGIEPYLSLEKKLATFSRIHTLI